MIRIETVAADVRYAFRNYARTPLTTLTIILTLALGIGFSSAVFSVLSEIFDATEKAISTHQRAKEISSAMSRRADPGAGFEGHTRLASAIVWS